MRKVRVKVHGKAVHRDPAPHAYSDRADLGLAPVNVFAPNANAPFRAPRLNAEIGKRVDHPALNRMDKAPHVFAAFIKVEHDVAHTLPRSVVGVAPAAPCLHHVKTRIGELGRIRAGAGCVNGGMLEQPDLLRRLARHNSCVALLHRRQRLAVRDESMVTPPFEARAGEFLGQNLSCACHSPRVAAMVAKFKREKLAREPGPEMNFDMNSCWARAVELVQANFQLLLVIAGIFLLLPSVALYLFFPDMQTIADPFADQDVVAAQMAEMAGPLIGGELFLTAFQFAGYAAMVALMSEARPTVGQAIGAGIKSVPSVFAILFLFFIMYFLGAVVIVLPITLLAGLTGAAALGVIALVPVIGFVAWLLARLSMSMPVLILEDTLNPVTAITRSFSLTKPRQWPIMGFWTVILVIFLVISVIFGGVMTLVASALGGGLATALITGLANGLTSMIIGMIVSAVAVAMHGQLSGPSADTIEDTFG